MLQKIRLFNYCQHRGLKEFNLSGDVIGVIGKNGRGKSNLARAISDTLTGNFHKKKEKIITYGESEGWSEVLFTDHNGDQYLVHRDLHKNAANILRMLPDPPNASVPAGQVVAGTVKETNAMMLRLLQAPMDVLSQIVFVGQEEINNLLFSNDAGRERIAQSFFGVGKARDIEKALGEILAKYPPDFDSTLQDSISAEVAEIEKIDQEDSEIEQSIFRISTNLVPEDIKSLTQARIRASEAMLSNSDRIQSLESFLAEADKEIQNLGEQRKSLEFEIEGYSRDDLENRVIKERCRIENTNELSRLSLVLNDARRRLEELPEESKEKEEKCSLCGSQVRSDRLKILDQIFRVEQAIERIDPAPPEGNLKGLEEGLAIFDEVEKDIRKIDSRVEYIQRQISESNSALSAIRGMNYTADPYATPEELERARETVRKCLETERELYELQQRQISNSRVKAVAERNLAALRARASIQRKNQRRRGVVTKLRERFHYSGAPQRVVSSRISALGERVNYYLGMFGTRYRVRLLDGLKFRCIFEDKEIDAEELSGGEKVDLSLSFRLASGESYCSRVGFMILDEPTAWLDEDTVSMMIGVIDRLKDLAEENNFQFIIVTHSRPLIPHFDQVIELT